MCLYEGSDQQEPRDTSQASSSEDPDIEEWPEIKIMAKDHENWILSFFPRFELVPIIKGICQNIFSGNQ